MQKIRIDAAVLESDSWFIVPEGEFIFTALSHEKKIKVKNFRKALLIYITVVHRFPQSFRGIYGLMDPLFSGPECEICVTTAWPQRMAVRENFQSSIRQKVWRMERGAGGAGQVRGGWTVWKNRLRKQRVMREWRFSGKLH